MGEAEGAGRFFGGGEEGLSSARAAEGRGDVEARECSGRVEATQPAGALDAAVRKTKKAAKPVLGNSARVASISSRVTGRRLWRSTISVKWPRSRDAAAGDSTGSVLTVHTASLRLR